MKKEKPLHVVIANFLKQEKFKPETVRDFKAMYAYLEKGKEIDHRIVTKFEKLGLFDRNTKKMVDPENGLGLLLHAMLYEGLLEMKCGKKIYSLERAGLT